MGQDLNGRTGAVVIGRHTELSADIVCSRRRIVSGKNKVSKVPALLGHIQNKIGGFEVCLRDIEVEDCLSSCQVDWDSGIDTLLCRGRSGKHCQGRDRGDIH